MKGQQVRLFNRCLVLLFCLMSLGLAQAQSRTALYFSHDDEAGKKTSLTDYAGKTVLVSFFTSGCNLCTRDLKLMREFYVGNAKRNFVLLAINMDSDKKDFDTYMQIVNQAIPKEQRFPVFWRNAPGHKDNFGQITHQPSHFVINPKGQLLWKREGSFQPADWDNLWEALDAK